VAEKKLASFWMIRHALVAPEALSFLYGRNDVPLCDHALATQGARYAALAARLPVDADWVVTPLSRTRLTAEKIFAGGYGTRDMLVEPGLVEQDFGDWQGRKIEEFNDRPVDQRHPFWPVAAAEQPPGGESFVEMIERVGRTIERLANIHQGRNIVAVSHGGAIRAAIAYAMGLSAHQALTMSVENLSLTRLEYHGENWRFVSLNEQLST
jgi:broad specificity phosphatase PhoE